MSLDLAEPDDYAFLRQEISKLTTEREHILVSEWARRKRYLPKELTAKPGKFDPNYTPYLIEIMDFFSESHPGRKLAVRKGGQIGVTVGVYENAIGYNIDHNPCTILLITADEDAAKLGIETRIDTMLEQSGLLHKIRASSGGSKRTGNTARKKEFAGGSLNSVGSRSPTKMRSISAKWVLIDEMDGCTRIVGLPGKEEGTLAAVTEKRSDTFLSTRKLGYVSTPTNEANSQITEMFLMGDQREYHIPCIHCDFYQPLKWHGVTSGGYKFGFTWDVDKTGKLKPETVGYICCECSAIFYNHDKSIFLEKGIWTPHAEPQEADFWSYHLPSFYSPIGMYAWSGIATKWFKAWDVKKDRVRDIDAYQTFRNLEEGQAWKVQGRSPKSENVQKNRRTVYSEGEIPNKYAIEETGAPVIFLTCAVDVHATRLDIGVSGWCQDRQCYSILWESSEVEGRDTEDLSSKGPWQRVRDIMADTWVADDLREYKIEMTLVDASWGDRTDICHQFCSEYEWGVFPVHGRSDPIKGKVVKEFSQSESGSGNIFFNVTVGTYKDRLAHWIDGVWAEHEHQPQGYLNFPLDRRDSYFKQYESERRMQIKSASTGRPVGFIWERIGSRPNHAWDVQVYCMAALDIVAHITCTEVLELPKLNWAEFFNYVVPKKNTAGEWLPTYFSVHPGEPSVTLNA